MSFRRGALALPILLSLLFGNLLSLPVASGRVRAWAARPPGAQPEATTQPGGIVLEWQTPALELENRPDGTVQVRASGYSLSSQPGAPALPYTAALAALPPGTEPRIELLEAETVEIELSGPPARALQPEGVLRSTDGQVIGGAFGSGEAGAPLQPGPVVLEPAQIMRGAAVVRLLFYPAAIVDGRLQWITHLRVALHFDSTGARALNLPAPASVDPALEALQAAVINPQHLQASRPGSQSLQADPTGLTAAGQAAFIEVDRVGLTGVTYEALLSAGFPVQEVNPQNLRLERAGKEIPSEWEGDGDTAFEPGERLLFYAEPRFSRWSRFDVYTLQAGGAPGARMTTRPAGPGSLPAGNLAAEVTAEKNAVYTPDCFCAPIPAGRDGDRWVWEELQAGTDSAAAEYDLNLANVSPGHPGRLELWMIGYTDVQAAPIDHRVEVTFNAAPLGKLEWDGKQAVHGTFDIPAGLVKEGENKLSLSLPGLEEVGVEAAWLDAFSVRYRVGAAPLEAGALLLGEAASSAYTLSDPGGADRSVYDVTDPDQPQKLSGLQSQSGVISFGDPAGTGDRRYWAGPAGQTLSPAGIRIPVGLQTGGSTGADYLIVTPISFAPALAALLPLRQSQGLTPAVEDVQAIYDAFGDGRPDPEAIRRYLQHAYTAWTPRPLYVLLVGDGTADPKRYSDKSSETFIPPYLAEVDPWAGETAADNRYAAVDGDDNLPDLLIGRLPVNSLAETQALVDKIVGYETDPVIGNWNQWGTAVADDFVDGVEYGGNFPAYSDRVISESLDGQMAALRLYLDPGGDNAAQIRQELLQNWNAGMGLLMFTGHASIHQWTAENIFHLDDIPQLKNGRRLPVLIEMTCFTAAFHVPGLPTLDEALVRSPQGGVVAAWGPTGLGLSDDHAWLAEGFFASLLDEAQPAFGKAALAGKLRLTAQSEDFSGLVDTFTLLGDPAGRLNQTAGIPPQYLPILHK